MFIFILVLILILIFIIFHCALELAQDAKKNFGVRRERGFGLVRRCDIVGTRSMRYSKQMCKINPWLPSSLCQSPC